MKKENWLLVFPDGVGIRNYLYSKVFSSEKYALSRFHNFGPDTIEYLKDHIDLSREHSIPDFKEGALEKFLRELIALCRLQYNAKIRKNSSLLWNWNPKRQTLSKKAFYLLITMLAPFFASYAKILWLEKKYQETLRNNPFYEEICNFLKKERPDSVFCSHQRGLKMASIFAAASDLGIKTVTVIYSWDNLPKARLALRADEYWVWSQHMRDELLTYYPEIDARQVVITGTPQFDFYQDDRFLLDREQFCRDSGLDATREIICFSGDDVITSPDDAKYLEDLAASLVRSGLDKKVQILFRRCPVDFSARYDGVLSKYPDLIKVAAPLWHIGGGTRWTEVYPLFSDIALLLNTAYHCAAVVNLASTMAFDFAMFDKPCLYINYDQQIKLNPKWSAALVYKFEHFKSMSGLNPVGWVNSASQFPELIEKVLENPGSIGPDKHNWMQRIAVIPFNKTSQ